jgi:hypothetical protein
MPYQLIPVKNVAEYVNRAITESETLTENQITSLSHLAEPPVPSSQNN